MQRVVSAQLKRKEILTTLGGRPRFRYANVRAALQHHPRNAHTSDAIVRGATPRSHLSNPLLKVIEMKKSLIALAVMAASGAALAQSSVQVYGIVDAWVGSERDRWFDHDNNQSRLNQPRQTKLGSGGISGSRFGFKGTEDLGGGLKANFLLEQGFEVDTGKAAETGKQFNRQAYVGFSGGFGEVKLGKIWTAYDDISGATNSAFDSAFSATAKVFASGGYNANPNNGLYYATPSFGGFSGALSYALGEDKSNVKSASKVWAAHVKYEEGPIFAGLAYQREDDGIPGNDAIKFTRLNGSYDFGMAKALASYGRVTEGNDKTNEYHLGVDVPLGGNLTLSGGYAYSKTKVAGVVDSKRNGVGIALGYNLSKRTMAYAGVNNSKEKDGAGQTIGKYNLYAVGVKHTF
jgi:predicted porin